MKSKANLLDDFEVYITYIKIVVGMGVFYRPFLYFQAGLVNAVVAEVLIIWIISVSNANLVKCIRYMPRRLTRPERNLTYGQVVHYILDMRQRRVDGIDSAMSGQQAASKVLPGSERQSLRGRWFQNFLDL